MDRDLPHVDQVSLHHVLAEDVSLEISIHDYFGVVVIKVGQTEIKLFTELDQIAGIKRTLNS